MMIKNTNNKVIRAFRNQSILGDTYGYWGSYSF